MRKITILLLIISIKGFALSLNTEMTVELDSTLTREEGHQLNSAENELSISIEKKFLEIFSLGPKVIFSSEIGKGSEPISRLHSLGPVASVGSSFFNDKLELGLSYSYQFIQDNYLQNKYSLKGEHQTEVSILYAFNPLFSTEIYGEFVKFTGGIPLYSATPDYDYIYGINLKFDFENFNMGQAFERNVSAQLNEFHKRSNKVYDRWHFISYVGTSFYGIDAEVSAILYPLRNNYYKTFAKDTFKDFDIGLNISKKLEF